MRAGAPQGGVKAFLLALLTCTAVCACQPQRVVTTQVHCPEAGVLHRTEALLQRLQAQPPSDAAETVRLAQARQAHYVRLLQRHPEAALRAAVSNTVFARLPAAVQQYFEQHTATVEGTLVSECLRRGNHTQVLEHTLQQANGRRLAVHFTQPPTAMHSNTVLNVQDGICVRDVTGKLYLVAQLPEPQLQNTYAQQGLAPQPAVLKTLIITVTFANAPTAVVATPAEISQIMAQVDAFDKEASFGHLSLVTTLNGPHPVSAHSDTFNVCDDISRGGVQQEATQAALRSGVDPAKFDRVSIWYAQSGGPCPGVVGIGSLGGPITLINAAFKNMGLQLPGTLAHEMGHNLGLDHAGTRDCSKSPVNPILGNATASDCNLNEYGDNADVMGMVNMPHYNAYFKERLGWLGPNSAQQLLTVARGGRFVLGPYAANLAQLKALKVARSNNDFYYLEYRQPGGFDAGFSGVLLHLGSAAGGRSFLLDTAGVSDVSRSPLQVGQTYQDSAAPNGGVNFTLVAADPQGATVDVHFGNDAPPMPMPAPIPMPAPGPPVAMPAPQAPPSTPSAPPALPGDANAALPMPVSPDAVAQYCMQRTQAAQARFESMMHP